MINKATTDYIIATITSYLPACKIYAFGSRVAGTNKRYSDLDIAIEADQGCQAVTYSYITEEFSNSDLPFKVDLINMDNAQDWFKEAIHSSGLLIHSA